MWKDYTETKDRDLETDAEPFSCIVAQHNSFRSTVFVSVLRTLRHLLYLLLWVPSNVLRCSPSRSVVPLVEPVL